MINNIRLISDLAGKASRYFETDSLSFVNFLTSPETANKYGFVPEKFFSHVYSANTYEMFWTATPEKFADRMKKEFDKYWTDDRFTRSKKTNLIRLTYIGFYCGEREQLHPGKSHYSWSISQ
ncbi:MAG: hypothetical protein U0T36_03065 [Saprospiraceae bacterium]